MSQVIVKGIREIEGILKDSHFLLVNDSAYKFLEIKDFFDSFPHVEFSEFTPNPLYEQVVRGVDVFNRNSCNLIVAVGGGSTIDVAKCIKLFCNMDSKINYLQQERKDTGVTLIAVPTTAGTGSESTRHAVIYYNGIKQSIAHTSIVPDIAVLEPTVLKTLPVYQKKCTMLDALCQAIESWWSINSTEESKEFSKLAIDYIVKYWRDYIETGSEEAATRIMEAANYAGRAINITATTAAHAMSYKITSMYNLPHGHAVAVCMTEVWPFIKAHYEETTDSRGSAYLKNTLSDIEKRITYDMFMTIFDELKMCYPKSETKEQDIQILAEAVNPDRLNNNPVALTEKVLEEMYRRIVR